MYKRTLSILLALFLVLSFLPNSSAAIVNAKSQFSDMPDNWATEALESAVENGLLIGDQGKIMPDDPLTRAQMATIIVRAFAAIEEGDLSAYTDIKSTDWFADSIAKAFKMGVMQGYDGKMNPNDKITREQAFAVLVRALRLTPAEKSDIDFDDDKEISQWARNEVYALINAGYVQGYNGKLKPQATISRAEFAQVMHNIIKQYINKSGVYTKIVSGNVMVNAPGVTLKNLTINGDLIIGDGVGDGEVKLENVTLKGSLVARGGGVDSIVIVGGSVEGKIIISKVDGQIRVSVEGGAEVEVVVVDDGKDDIIIEGEVGTIEVAVSGVPVLVQNATVDKITVRAEGPADLTITKDTVVKDIEVEPTSEGTSLLVEGRVTNIDTSAPSTAVSGSGRVNQVTTKEGADNSTITTPNTRVNNEKAAGVTAGGGKEVSIGENVTNNYDGSNVLTPPPIIVPPTYISISSVSIEGTAKVGQTLTATPTPSGATVSYQWKISDSSDGTYTNISGATSKTYIPTEAGKWLKVEVSGRGNYSGTQTSAAVGPVEDEVVPVTITGIAVKTEPAKITYTEGEELNLAGLVVTLIKSDSSTEDVALVDFADKGITVSIADGTLLTLTDTKVTITHTESTKTVDQAITVAKADIAVSKLDKNYYAEGDILEFTIFGLDPNKEVRVGMPISTGVGSGWESSKQVLTENMQVIDGGLYWVGTTDQYSRLYVSGTVGADLPYGAQHITLPQYENENGPINIMNTISLEGNDGQAVYVGVKPAEPEALSIMVKTPPHKLTYIEGDALELDELEVTVTMSDNTVFDFVFDDFTEKGITVSLENGTRLKPSDTKITITHTASDNSVDQAITVNKADIATSKLDKNYYAEGETLEFTIIGLDPNKEVRVGMPIYLGGDGNPWASGKFVLTDKMEDTGDGLYWSGTTDQYSELYVSGTVGADLPYGALHITLPDYDIGINNSIQLQGNDGQAVYVGVKPGEPEALSIMVKTPPHKLTYIEGDALELDELEVTVTMSDNTEFDFSFDDFTEKGITVSLENGTRLKPTDTLVTITHTASGNSVNLAITVNKADIATSKLDKNYYAEGETLEFTIIGLDPNKEVRVGMPIYLGGDGNPWASGKFVLTDKMEDTGDGLYWSGTTDQYSELYVSGTVGADLPYGALHITLPDYDIGINNSIQLQGNDGQAVYVGEDTVADITITGTIMGNPYDGAVLPNEEGVTVTLATTLEGADIYYTLDESEPTKENGEKYTSPFVVKAEKTEAVKRTVKAMAIKDDEQSEVAILEINFAAELPKYTVTFNVVGGNGALEARVESPYPDITSGTKIDQGSDVFFKAIPDANYQVKEWKLNDSVVGDKSRKYTLEDLNTDVHVTVEFEAGANPTIEEIDTENAVENVEVFFGTITDHARAALAQSIKIKDSKGQEHQVDVNWAMDNYYPFNTGEYDVIGTFELPEGIDQADPAMDLEVTAKVIVIPMQYVSTAQVDFNIQVLFGTCEQSAIMQLAGKFQ